MTPKAKVRIDKLDHSKIKSFYISKDTRNRVKSQPTEWGKIFVNHVSDKGLVSTMQIHEELLQLKQHKNKLIQNWAKDLNRHFSIQMTRKHIKRCTNSNH